MVDFRLPEVEVVEGGLDAFALQVLKFMVHVLLDLLFEDDFGSAFDGPPADIS